MRIRSENERLREEARLLREDADTIERVARERLGLIKPGEKLFILKDVDPGQALSPPLPGAAPRAKVGILGRRRRCPPLPVTRGGAVR